MNSTEIPEVRRGCTQGVGRLPANPTLCSRLSLPPQIARCVSKNSFPAPNITWHKNGEQLHAQENGELGGFEQPAREGDPEEPEGSPPRVAVSPQR